MRSLACIRSVFVAALLLPVATQCGEAISAVPRAAHVVPSSKKDDPIVVTKDGISLRRSEVAAALRSLPPRYRKMKLEDIFPLLVNQMLYNPDGPLDALRD